MSPAAFAAASRFVAWAEALDVAKVRYEDVQRSAVFAAPAGVGRNLGPRLRAAHLARALYLAYSSHMDRAKISQFRDHLSRYLDRVRSGGEVLVLDRNRPVARLVPVAAGHAASLPDSERLEALERQGLLRRGSGRLPEGWARRRRVKVKGVLDTLLRERESGW